MYSHYWSCSRRPDYRRFTMAGGEAPVHLLDSGGGRTPPYHAAADHDHNQASCASRPKPEGSLSAGELREQEQEEDWQWEGHEEEQWEELQQLCRRCHIVMSQLRRQAAALTDRSSLQDPAYASFLFEELQHLQWPGGGHHTPLDVRCDVCDASFLQLRRLALRHALCIDRKVALQAVGRRGSEGSWGGNVPPSQQQRLSYKEREGGAPWVYGGVQSPYVGGGGVKGLATVTPLSLGAQHHLEGVWKVTCCQPEVQKQTTGLVSDRVYVTTKSSSPDTKPAVHSIATQTSRPPSAAAAFFIRAAQKLSLSRRRRRRSLPGPASPPPEAPEPLLYTGGFSGALQLSPPTVPPCLLRAGSKVKEKPGMGKVRVMVRVCSSSSETPSLLRVDGRKKQLTLCQSHRRSSSSPPKIFPFDAIFSHDASQAEVCSGAVTEVIQSVVNGADGCIFCYGHADLGKTYTMIGRDCSTQSLGVAPTAISWLFKVMEERREKSGVGFSVRVSAVEISGREETLTDLLFELCSSSSSSSFGGQHQETPGPAVSLCEDPLCGSQLQNQTELRATNAERAAFFLDVALAARSSSQAPMDHEARQNSHFLFTLHLHQERADKSNKAAVSGRSRLHLLDLGSCETDLSRTREGGGAQCLSLSALGNVILALANGAKHVPFRSSVATNESMRFDQKALAAVWRLHQAFGSLKDSKLTMLLRESLGNINCQTTMIAHISDSPANYLETLTTVQLASCIHRTRKKSKHASSSSGGESSCEEGPLYRPPHLRSLHPRTVALDPDTPLLLSSDPDYSSSSEHSCDTVIYVGPGGAAISAQEVSDDEGPSFIPIIPSLNKKRRKDEPKPDGNHFKCNTFAELQERLDCIDGSEGPAGVSVQAKAAAGGTQAEAAESTEPTSLPKPDRNLPHKFSESMTSKCTNKPVQEPSTCPSTACLVDASRITSADGEKHLAPPPPWPPVLSPCRTSPNSEPAMRETAYLKGGVPEPSPSPSSPRTSRASPQPGMSQLALRLGQPDGSTERLHGGYLEEVRNLQAALFGKCLAGHFLRTTVTLQQPVELNGEDELVFTLVEELPSVLVPHNSRPSNLLSSDRNLSLQTVASGLQPISIISSINDEYDVYMSQQSTVELGATSTPTLFHNQPLCFPEQDSSRSTPNKPSLTQHADPTEASWLDRQARSGPLDTSVSAQTSHHASSLPRTTKPTSSAATSCSRQGGQQVDLLLQRRDTDPWESVFGCASKPSRSGMSRAPSRRPGGQSNSVPRPPKVQGSSSAQRVVDGCERSSVRRGETLIKLPRLSQDTMTLGTVSVPLSSEVKWGREGTSATGTLKFSSLGKKSNLHKNVTIFNIFPPAQKSSLDQKSRAALPPSALKTSGDTGKSSVPKTSTSEEEFHRRIRADSFRRKTSASRTGSARTSLSLKTHGAKAESSRCYSSPNSLEQSDSQTSAGSRFFRDSGSSTSGGNNRSNRSHLDSAFTSSFQDSPGASEITIQAVGQDNRESSSRVAASNESKVQTLPTSSSKSLRSVPEAPDDGRNTSLPLTGKSQTQLGTGVRRGGGTIIGTKRAISRVANRCVSEVAAVTQRKQLSRSQGVTGSDSTDSGTSSVSESLLTAPLPSPYSKITAPRRPQRCSSGHGSDNSSILSGELPPAMGRTALFYHSGGSSGYESMMRDSETTGSTSSAHDSMSERGVSSSNRSRAFKSPRKRGNGFQRRRLIPAPLPDTSLLEGKVGGQWVDHPPLRCSLKEPFEIKVYEIDDVECMQRSEEQPFHDVQQGLLYFNARLRMLERRQQRIAELQIKHQGLQAELEEAKTRLVLQASRWSGEFSVDQDLDQDSQEYLEALAQVTAELEDCVNFCKSHLMMETCFDITVTTAGRQEGQQEVEL